MRKSLSVIVTIGLLIASCWAQKESLLIGPGDTLEIHVLEASELEQHGVVNDAGALTLLLGGTVRVAGLTPSEASASIEKALVRGQFILHPHVSVVVSHYATQTVSVLGQVRVPGGYAIATPRTILEVLALAGGVNETASRKIVIERRGSRQRVDFFLSNTPAAALDGNAMVYPGDIVFVPKADIVYVLGDVGRPGGFMNTTNNGTISALQVLALAGGTKNSAVPSHARLIRKKPDGGYSEINLSLSAMQKGRQADIPLQADDILYVPFSYLRNIAVNANTLVSSAESAAIYHF